MHVEHHHVWTFLKVNVRIRGTAKALASLAFHTLKSRVFENKVRKKVGEKVRKKFRKMSGEKNREKVGRKSGKEGKKKVGKNVPRKKGREKRQNAGKASREIQN